MLDLSLISILLTVSATSHVPGDVAEQFERWERRLRARVERLHVVPADAETISPCDVVVSFGIGDGGSPQDAVVRESSCSRYYERRALSLVRGLNRIGAVPSNAGKEHRVLLKLTYGEQADGAADRRLSDALEAERRARVPRNLAIVAGASDRPAAGVWQSAER